MNKKKIKHTDDIDEQTDQVVDQSAELEALQNKYLRALADYQNLEKRLAVSLEQTRQQATQSTIVRFLGLLDDMENASAFVQDEGLKMIMNKFVQILHEAGVEELELIGTEFDPHFADAVEVVPGEEDNIITEIVRRGYRIGDSVMRPAQVKVSKK